MKILTLMKNFFSLWIFKKCTNTVRRWRSVTSKWGKNYLLQLLIVCHCCPYCRINWCFRKREKPSNIISWMVPVTEIHSILISHFRITKYFWIFKFAELFPKYIWNIIAIASLIRSNNIWWLRHNALFFTFLWYNNDLNDWSFDIILPLVIVGRLITLLVFLSFRYLFFHI